MKKRFVWAVCIALISCMFFSACGNGGGNKETEASKAGASKTEATDSKSADTQKPAETQKPEDTQKPAETQKSADAQGSGGSEKYVIGVSVADTSNNFYVNLREGLEGAVRDGDELMLLDANFDASRQLDDIDDMIQQGVSAILMDCVDSNAIKPAIEACKAAGIPVIAYNSPVDADVDALICSDNYLAGQIIGEALAEAIDYKGQVAMLTFNQVEVCADRANGFYDVMTKYPDIEVVAQQECTPGTDTALPIAENMLQAYPDLVGMFAMNDASALGCVAAAESAGLIDQVSIVGVDANADARDAIAAGKMLASAGQYPDEMGKQAVELAYKLLAGETVEEKTVLSVFLCDKSNAAQ